MLETYSSIGSIRERVSFEQFFRQRGWRHGQF
jgi:hypothetical protein